MLDGVLKKPSVRDEIEMSYRGSLSGLGVLGPRVIEPYAWKWSEGVKPRKREVYELAVKLAQSGKMRNWRGIQDHLLEQGYKRAPELLNSEKIRAVLDICCKGSRAAD